MSAHKSNLLSSTFMPVALGVALAAGAIGHASAATSDGLSNPAAAVKSAYIQLAACKACNPCAVKKVCGGCNPCGAKKACGGCNPCATKKACGGCSPCAAKKACGGCNPCATKKKKSN